MACITCFASPMTTTQFAHAVQYAIHHKEASAQQFSGSMEHKSLSVRWVVVTDNLGKRRLQMKWAGHSVSSGHACNIPLTGLA